MTGCRARRVGLATLVTLLGFVVHTSAAWAQTPAEAPPNAATTSPSEPPVPATAVSEEPPSSIARLPDELNPSQLTGVQKAGLVLSPPRNRSILMGSLYAWTAGMQALDTHSTLTAHQAGLRERNPIMRGLAERPLAFIAVKAGATTGLIFLARKGAKHHKVATTVALVGINIAYATLVSHNYKMARAHR